jgi:Uma2 family endonuclease
MAVPGGRSRAGALVRVPMTWEEYEALEPDARHEYVEGCLVVNPRPTGEHQIALRRLSRLLEDAVATGYEVYGEWSWKPGKDEWAPDIMVCPREKTVRFTGIPELIVEILSSNRALDLVMKPHKYAQAGLPRYWVFDPEALVLTAFELRDGFFMDVAVVGPDDEVTLDFGVGTVTVNPRQLMADR